jgi:hypothetical protein
MRRRLHGFALSAILMTAPIPASADAVSDKLDSIMKALKSLCLAGGSESVLSARGDVELRSKIKDLLKGNFGGEAVGQTEFSQHVWDEIIGGISKDFTAIQAHEADEARQCMKEVGAPLVRELMNAK